MNMADRIQHLRKSKGISQEELADKVGVSRQAVSMMTVAGATNTKLDYNSLAKGDGRMCTVFDEIAKEGEARGIVETGLEFGLSESDILSRLQKKLDVSLQMAQEYLAMFGKQTV